MNNLFDPSDVSALVQRIENLAPANQRQWGKMNAVQMLAHCNKSMETVMGKHSMKRVFIGKLMGSFWKPMVLGKKPFGKNSPTDKSYIFTNTNELDFEKEKSKLVDSVNEFFTGGASKCTTHPHPFFGSFTPEQWAVFQWKHLDHHLRQFGA